MKCLILIFIGVFGKFENGTTVIGLNDTIIVINQFSGRSPIGPVLFNISGNFIELENFTYQSGTGSYLSCSFVQNGNMYIIGGHSEFVRQISIVQSRVEN